MKLRTATLVCLTVLVLLACGVASAEFTDTSNGRVVHSQVGPLPSVAESNINEYTFQDEQLNLTPDDEETRVLRTNQKVNLNQFVPHLIPMTHLDINQVRELRGIARQICRLEGGNAQIVRDKITGDHFIMVTAPPFMLPRLEQTFKALDKAWLNSTDDGSGILQWRAHYRDVRNVDRIARTYTGGISVFHELDNTVAHLVVPSLLASYVTIANKADVPVNRIMLDTQIYEVATNNDLKLGLDFIAWKNTVGQDLFDLGYLDAEIDEEMPTLRTTVANLRDADANFRTFGAVATAEFVDFLSSKGKAKVLYAQTLQTVSGKITTARNVDSVPAIMVTGALLENAPNQFFFDADVNDVPAGANPFNQGTNWSRFVNFQRDSTRGQAGLFLNVLPVVGTESTETFVGLTVSEITGKTPMGLPMLTESSVVTQVRVRDGEQTLVGGLTRSEKVKQKAGIPWLGDIPVLGYIFGGETSIDRDSCIVILMESTTSIGYVNPADGRPLTDAEVKALKDKNDFKALTVKTPAITDAEQLLMAQAAHEAPVHIPADAFGFDQWFLDLNKMCPTCPPGSFTTVEAAAEFGPTEVPVEK